jgi:uncharacterized membrane protein YqiK
MSVIVLVIGVAIALLLLVSIPRAPDPRLRGAAGVGAALVLVGAVALSSIRYVSPDEVGIVSKNALGPSLREGRIIATGGEMGIQADVLAPGWHFWYWPVVYDVRTVPLVEIKADEVGLLEARDGLPLPEGQVFAEPWPDEMKQRMLDARYFLTEGRGQKGAQATVLTAGKYRLNTELFKVTNVKVTEILPGEVGVLKANFGRPASLLVEGFDEPASARSPAAPPGTDGSDGRLRLARPGEMGVRADVLHPGKYPINTHAFTVVEIWTTQMIAHYTQEFSANPTSAGPGVQEEREITVRTSDGFTFPVDVRIEYHIRPEHAPIVVARLGDDEGDRFRNQLNSAVRATFRNAAEGVKALDYVQQRSQQEQMALRQLAEDMASFGVTITAVRIGNVGDEKSLGALLKTQTDREIAKQEQITFQEQQKAAEKKKELARVTQEAEEEKRLATAAYAVKIAEEEKRRRVIEANAEAEAIAIRARAQSDAYRLIAGEIGRGNAALVELLKIIGERNIQITPRVMITGHSRGDGETTALIGTMLDTMISREEDRPATPR